MKILNLINPFSEKFNSCKHFQQLAEIKQKILTIVVTVLSTLLTAPFLGVGGLIAFRLMVEKFHFKQIGPEDPLAERTHEAASGVFAFDEQEARQEVEVRVPTDSEEEVSEEGVIPESSQEESVFTTDSEEEDGEERVIPESRPEEPSVYSAPPIQGRQEERAEKQDDPEHSISEEHVSVDRQGKEEYVSLSDTQEEDSTESVNEEGSIIGEISVASQYGFEVFLPENDESILGSQGALGSSVLGSFVEIKCDGEHDTESLLTYTKEGVVALNPILSEVTWNDLLDANDLSYQAAKAHTVSEHKRARVDEHLLALSTKLHMRGWDDFAILFGKTGAFNVDDDASCIILTNRERGMIVVAFHGSRNGSKWNVFNPQGDWGANWDSPLESAEERGLIGAPEGVCFHRGFGRNFLSVQENLLLKLEQIKATFERPPQIIVTGHSKGAAEAGIAAPVIKTCFGGDSKVALVTFSAPQTFNTVGVEWVHQTVGLRNCLSIIVPGDPVAWGSYVRDYAPVGIVLEDSIERVRQRTKQWKSVEGLERLEQYANYHYGARRGKSLCFVPQIVMRHKEILEAYRNWEQSNFERGVTPEMHDGFSSSTSGDSDSKEEEVE